MSSAKRISRQIVDMQNSKTDTYFFFFLLIAGILLVFVLRELDAPALPIVLVPVASIGLYVALVLLSGAHQRRPDRSADNCYYMGFIFTLASLSYALYKFGTKAAITETLINDFGVAIASTIAGMIARLWLNQLRSDPTEIANEAQQNLNETARELRGELIKSMQELQHYRTALHQMFKESTDRTMEEFNQHLTQSISHFEEFAKRALGHIDDVYATHEKNAEDLSQITSKTVQALERMMEQIQSIKAPSDTVIRQFILPATEQIQTAATAMAAASTAIEEHTASETSRTAKLVALTERTTQLIELLDQRLEQSSQIGERLNQLTSTISNLPKRIIQELGKIWNRNAEPGKNPKNHVRSREDGAEMTNDDAQQN